MDVVLYRVGRNLNRAIRACHAGGIRRMIAVRCGDASGALYSARDAVEVERADAVPHGPGTAYLEVDGDVPMAEVDWTGVDRLVLGGESTTLPRAWRGYGRIRLPQAGSLCHTVEAALSIALYERARSTATPLWRYAGHGLYACALPRRRDVLWMAREAGVRTLIDLTQRERQTVRRACEAAGIRYTKIPTPHDRDPILDPSAELVVPAVVCCYHGRNRSERFVAQWRRLHADR